MNDAFTETERLFIQAQDIANRRLGTPSERAVLEIFDELRAERDRMAWTTDGSDSTVVH